MSELNSAIDRLKEENAHALRELEAWKRVAQDNGLSIGEEGMNGVSDAGNDSPS